MKKNLLLTFSLLISVFFAFSQTTFTAGNIVVVRVGDGSGNITNLAPVNLLEYTPQGVLVQTIPLNSITAGARLTLNLNNAQEGGLNLSTDKNFLSLVGYDADISSGAVLTGFDKVVARISSTPQLVGGIDYSTKILKSEVSNIRQTTSIDGNSFWVASSQHGIRYVPFGNPTTTSSVSIVSTPTNTKSLNIFNGSLYAGGFNNTFGIGTVGTGTPTTSSTLSAALPGLPTGASANANGIYFFDLDNNTVPDVLYTIDGINLRKYSFINTNVDYVNTLSNPAANGTYGIYSSAPTLTISGGGGTGATGAVIFNGTSGKVTSWYLSNRGTGYTSAPTVTVNGTLTSGTAIAAPTTTVTSTPAWVLNSSSGLAVVTTSTVTAGGTGYSPSISITGDGTGATANATITNGAITALTITNGGSGYTVPPVISFTSATGSGAIATATLTGDVVTGATIVNGGTGYGATATISGGSGTGATATATSVNGVVTAINITNPGNGFLTAPTVTIGGEGSGATATGAISNTGNGYGITGIVNAGKVELFVTSGTGTSNHYIQRITDAAGYNVAASLTYNTLAFAGTNNVFRGIAFTPGTTTTLPVSLTSFTGKKTLNGNQLNWATASEVNNQRFDILRSTDKDNFQVISSVTGKNKAAQYNYVDAAPASGYNYYKLNQIDFDGTVTTHDKIVAINSDLSDAESTIFVSEGTLTYSINSNVAANTSLQIFDMNGRRVLSKDLTLKAGLTLGDFSVQSLINGVYVARLMVNGKALAIKFVK